MPTQVSYLYKNTAGAFVALADPTSVPADAATAEVNGRGVPYIVRLEQGTIDRAVYQIAALYDGTDPTPFRPDGSWNRRLVYTFGGGCDGGFHQGNATGGVINDLFLAQGYAVASSSLNVLNNNCSTIISAEAAMMVKEHFIETYGPVAHTIGWGGSGGAIQQYDIADAYPGILDGIVPGVSFPDPFTTLGPVTDCRLLDNYFAATGGTFTAEQQRAVAGFTSYDTCQSWDATFANRITATDSCDPSIPVEPALGPGDEPGRRQVLGRRAVREPARSRPAHRLHAQRSRQRRRAVRPAGADRQGDHGTAVRRPQREHRRVRLHRQAGSRSGPPPTRRRSPRPTATTW